MIVMIDQFVDRTTTLVKGSLRASDVTVPREQILRSSMVDQLSSKDCRQTTYLLQREGHDAYSGDDILSHGLEVLQETLHC